jgi:hypothetical protein
LHTAFSFHFQTSEITILTALPVIFAQQAATAAASHFPSALFLDPKPYPFHAYLLILLQKNRNQLKKYFL